jgi:hypothetical protein
MSNTLSTLASNPSTISQIIDFLERMGVTLREMREEQGHHDRFLIELLCAWGFEGKINAYEINKFIDEKFGEKIDKETDRELRKHIKPRNHSELLKSEILEQKSIKDAFVFCQLKNILPQQYGSLLEYYIIKKEEGMKKNRESGSGDCIKDGIDYEIKVSIFSPGHGFQFDQIRVNRCQVDYLLYGYLLNEENVDRLGDLFKFKLTHDEMKELLSKYGFYKGPTKSEIGGLSVAESLSGDGGDDSSLNNNNKKHLTYRLQAYPNSPCWKEMMEKYLVK